MNDLVKRLRASVNLGAVRGNSFERGVCESQMSEAASVITAMQEEIAALRERNAALEKVAEAAQKLSIYHPNFFELHDALREAGYLGGGE